VWRRNQYLASRLVALGLVDDVTFIEPAGFGRGRRFEPEPRVRVLRPRLLLPRRLGGLWLLAVWLRFTTLRRAGLLWVNDATLGTHCLSSRFPALYDVTDDWRTAPGPARVQRRLVRAEDRLTARSTVVVCSAVLRDRWEERYGVRPVIVHNGVADVDYAAVTPQPLGGPEPHVGYVGTLHGDRLDLALVAALALDPRIGTLHLLGPSSLTPAEVAALPGAVLHGAGPAEEVPRWLVAFDVLVCPHQVSDFTLSLDAIKAYEYLASGRPVVATPTSGFQELGQTAGVTVIEAARFSDAVAAAVGGAFVREPATWSVRAREFAAVLAAAS
jgi:teichuronic acid biosynthesis glycosyltransferase TuaH